MVHDRGDIKWTTLMLPEHAELLRDLRKQQEYKEKPLLDEQQLEDNEYMLQAAFDRDAVVEIKYFKAHQFHFAEGKLRSLNEKGYITLDNEDRTVIYFEDIIEVIVR